MAKIIKHGLSPQEYCYQIECTNCHSVIEFEQSDVHSDQLDGDYVVCPVCESWVDWRVVKGEGRRVLPC